MRPSPWLTLALALAGCKVFSVNDSEKAVGRVDPYAGPNTGALRLALEEVNGCAIRATGEPVGQSALAVPYPAQCEWPSSLGPEPSVHRPLDLLTGTDYFLNQISLMDRAVDLHIDPNDMDAVARWMQTATRFRDLDWSGLSVVNDIWAPSEDTFAPGYFAHRVIFGGAQWLQATDDSFRLEVLDASGTPRVSETYARSDFLATTGAAGHTQLGWEQENVGPPDAFGSVMPTTPPPVPPGAPPASPPVTRSFVRFEVIGSVHPERTFRIDSGFSGDGAIRLTWSQLPNAPFYFPVRFVHPDELPETCYSGADPTQRVRCTGGLAPEVQLSRPANGKFYAAGEAIHLRLLVKDAAGNLLHPPESLPSWNDFAQGRSNGLLYLNPYVLSELKERDTISGFHVAGPRQAMKPYYDLSASPYFQSPTEALVPGAAGYGGANTLVPGAAAAGAIPGGRDLHPPTTYTVVLPTNAEPGTYSVFFKVNRQFYGERFTKMIAVPFQVGQEEETTYPGRVGNCGICHRGVMALDNVRHGLGVDNIEGCKACHNRDNLSGGRHNTIESIHAIHFDSPRYTANKANCAMCHLTRASATRASYIACGSCHKTLHAGEYWKMATTSDSVGSTAESVYGNCAQTCHTNNPTPLHILPKD